MSNGTKHLEERHGLSTGNVDPFFQGGGHDFSAWRDPYDLTPYGDRQAFASGIVAGQLGFERVFTSKLSRARSTGRTAVWAAQTEYSGLYGDIHLETLSDFHEVDHGSLERQRKRVTRPEAKQYERVARDAMENVLRYQANINPELITAGYLPWVVGKGRGDGETYTWAGLRICQALDELDKRQQLAQSLIFGHGGAMHKARILSSTLNTDKRQELRNLFVEGPLWHRRRFALNENTQPSLGELERLFKPAARHAKTILEFLVDEGVPPLRDLLGKDKRTPNAAIIEVETLSDGRRIPLRMIEATFPKENEVALTKSNVSFTEQTFVFGGNWH